MTRQELLERRWAALLPSPATSPQAAVARLGAVQAQDPGMAALAVAVRTGGTTESVREALDEGTVLRTHVLRPTWHLVARDDLRWMTELTAPSGSAGGSPMRCSRVLERS